MKKLGKLVLTGLLLSLLMIGVVYSSPILGAEQKTKEETRCYLGCCLMISSWCVWYCTVCETVETQTSGK